MEIIGVQTDIEWEDRDTNFARVRELLAGVRISKGALIVLPEMFSVGFSFNEKKSVDTRRETEHFLTDIARQHACHVIGGMATKIEKHESDGCNAANELIIAGPSGEILGTYRKLHPFSLVGEGVHHAAGECVTLVECGGFQVAPFICYDLRFPEAFRIASSLGAEILVVIANWPSARVDHWTTLLKARAIENQAYVIGVNRTGTDPSHIYPGKSIIVDPMGRVLAEAGSAPCLVRATADKSHLLDWRAAFPALRDRREDLAANVLESVEEPLPPQDIPVWCQP